MADREKKATDEAKEPVVSTPVDPEEVEDLFSGLDNEEKAQLLVRQTFGMMGITQMSQENEIAKKITPEHITEYLGGAREQMRNSYKERHERKIFTTVLVALSLVFFVAIIVLLRDNPDVLEKIIYTVGGVVIGAFGGYGFGSRKSKGDEED